MVVVFSFSFSKPALLMKGKMNRARLSAGECIATGCFCGRGAMGQTQKRKVCTLVVQNQEQQARKQAMAMAVAMAMVTRQWQNKAKQRTASTTACATQARMCNLHAQPNPIRPQRWRQRDQLLQQEKHSSFRTLTVSYLIPRATQVC